MNLEQVKEKIREILYDNSCRIRDFKAVHEQEFDNTTDRITSFIYQDIFDMVIAMRNAAHVNCLEDKKQAFNHVVNFLEKYVEN